MIDGQTPRHDMRAGDVRWPWNGSLWRASVATGGVKAVSEKPHLVAHLLVARCAVIS
ncbi:hypothetical protein RKE25_22805 (plasmid) [Dyella sp. BiH032]|uniref:hypothetical protein n=1 Tax=Dyella sp. BiH032 TaxID=3075430 RepID=UPI0028933EE1|nr:hypothetical protein [Dyella sp. BiH032]WNL48366.1 hypothetical protein RKE25_22805 [Dyella sp. BiH032]